MNKIILDFDSTIADSAGCIIKKLFDIDWKPSELEWDFAPYGTPETRKQMIASFNTDSFWKNLELMPGFLDWLHSQSTKKIPLYICSRRIYNDSDKLIDWCRRNGIDQYIADYIFIAKNYDKSFLVDTDTVIIDDKPDCFFEASVGQKVLFGDYSYSKSFFEKKGVRPEDFNIIKVADWQNMPLWMK